MHIVFAYIKFLFRSTNQHGVHSPFVYNMVTKCFYDRKKYSAYSILKEYRRSLRKDKRTIQIKDFGAGSRVFRSDKREVSEMARTAGISPKRARLLNRVVRYLEVDQALELGTHLGLGTAGMAAGNKVKITTIEGCPETAAIAKEKLEEFGLNDIELRVGKFEEFFKDGKIQDSKFKIQDSSLSHSRELRTENYPPGTSNRSASAKASAERQPTTHNSELTTHKLDLIYIDGNHQKEATLEYFQTLLPIVHNESVMIFDDIHWSEGMEETWEIIKQHPQVTVSIDTFQWGLVFFRREQEKEHFVIRI